MRLFSLSGLSALRNTVLQKRRAREAKAHQDADILNTVEQVVDDTDGRIRLVSGYRKKLFDTVHSALEYADALVQQIPAPIHINRNAFASDPHLNAFFASFTEVRQVLHRSSEIREYIDDAVSAGATECCALLCIEKSEKPVIGMALSGDQINRDVQQIAVSFSDHRIYSPARSETEAREGLKHCLFSSLVTNALEQIAQSKARHKRLQDERNMLNARLLHFRHRLAQDQSGTQERDTLERHIDITLQELRDIDQTLMHAPAITPQESFQRVLATLSHPDKFVRLRQYPLRLSKMGIRLGPDSGQPHNQLTLTEATMGELPPRIVTLITFPLNILLDWSPPHPY